MSIAQPITTIDNTNKRAWMLFLSSDNYVYFVLNTFYSLKTANTIYPIYCGCTKNVSDIIIKILNICGIHTFILPDEELSNIKLRQIKNWVRALPKLLLFKNQNNLDKIVYLDSDIYVYSNIDDLFDKPHLSAVIDGTQVSHDTKIKDYTVGKSVFCSGLLVWDFTVDNGENIFNIINYLSPEIQWHDQNILNFVYNSWRMHPELHLDYTYSTMTYTTAKIDKANMPKVIHFISGQEYKTGMPFINMVFKPQDWGDIPIVYDYYAEMHDHIIELGEQYGFVLPEINLDNVIVPSSTICLERQNNNKEKNNEAS